jgi:hypothetical protein
MEPESQDPLAGGRIDVNLMSRSAEWLAQFSEQKQAELVLMFKRCKRCVMVVEYADDDAFAGKIAVSLYSPQTTTGEFVLFIENVFDALAELAVQNLQAIREAEEEGR